MKMVTMAKIMNHRKSRRISRAASGLISGSNILTTRPRMIECIGIEAPPSTENVRPKITIHFSFGDEYLYKSMYLARSGAFGGSLSADFESTAEALILVDDDMPPVPVVLISGRFVSVV